MNDFSIPANLKGIKKKAGTTPPANIGGALVPNSKSASSGNGRGNENYALKLELGSVNKVELHYVNTEKLFYMIVYFVEATTVEQIVHKVQGNKFRPKEEVVKYSKSPHALSIDNRKFEQSKRCLLINTLVIRQTEDSDVQATSSSLSLKDPLSFMDMGVPIRSVHCPHLQCFDATIYLGMMEQTPTWLCPVCNKSINPDDLVLDG